MKTIHMRLKGLYKEDIGEKAGVKVKAARTRLRKKGEFQIGQSIWRPALNVKCAVLRRKRKKKENNKKVVWL